MTQPFTQSSRDTRDLHKPTLRVTHVAAPAAVGGLESVVRTLAGGQRDRGHLVSLVALLERGVAEPALLADLRVSGVHVEALTFRPRAYIAQMRALAHYIRQHSPDIVHSHGYQSDILASLLKRRHRPALVSTVHGFTSGDRKTRLYEWLQIRSYRRFDAVVAVSSQIAQRLERSGVPRQRLHAVRNATAPQVTRDRDKARAEVGIAGATFAIGWVGRISREKGLDVLIDALASLQDLSIQLVVVGDGPDSAMLKDRSRTLRVADRIHWLGEVPNAAVLFSAFDALVLSSRTEGTPITLLEAMQAGIPVIATSVGGVPDVISPKEGILVPPERPDLLGRAVRDTLLNRKAAAERAQHALTRLRTAFGLSSWLDSYDDIYRTIRRNAPNSRGA